MVEEEEAPINPIPEENQGTLRQYSKDVQNWNPAQGKDFRSGGLYDPSKDKSNEGRQLDTDEVLDYTRLDIMYY